MIDTLSQALLPVGEPTPQSVSAAPSTPRAWQRQDWAVALFLFLATAAVVVWQNSRLGILWDLSYILETASRLALGDIPYRDFPLPHAPLTFLIQAGLIKLTGRVFFHQVLYCAVVGGAATVLTWRIVLSLLPETLVSARRVAFLLSAPLTVLGIYSIFPHPFYDPDCTFAILLGIWLLQAVERRAFPPGRTFLTGVILVVPVFVKQNCSSSRLPPGWRTTPIGPSSSRWPGACRHAPPCCRSIKRTITCPGGSLSLRWGLSCYG